jgi:hypothetical protein
MMTSARQHPIPEDVAGGTRPGARALAATGAVATVAAAAATVVTAAAAKAVDVPMQVAAAADEAAQDIPLWAFAQLTVFSAVIGVLLAIALNRYTRRPAGTFVVVTTLLTVVSFVGPITAHHATTATRVVLGLTHVIAAAIIIPALAARLARR